MEIAVSGLANLGPAPPATPPAAADNSQQELVLPPIHNGPAAAVVTPSVGEKEKKKDKGGLFKRLVKLGSNRQVADRADNSVNNSTKKSDVPSWVNDAGGIPPTPKFASSKPRLPPKGTPGNFSSKKFENPSNVFVPPTMDESANKNNTSTAKKANDNKDKPPKYIVIGAKKPSSSNLSMPDQSQAGATLDESYSTVNHTDSYRHLRVRRLDEEEEDDDARTKEEDIAYCQASVSETSSVSSASLQDALEWKIFGGGAAKGGKDKEEDKKKSSTRSSLKKPPPAAAAAPALDVVLDDEPPKAKRASEKEIAMVLANEAMERRASMVNPEDGGGKKKFQSTCFNPHATSDDADDDDEDEVSTLHTTGPSILSAPLNVPDSKEAAAHVHEEAKEPVKEDLDYGMYSPVAAAASLPKQLQQEEEDAMLARKLQNQETEQEDQDQEFARKLQQEEEEQHFRKSMSRRHVMQDDSRASAYERQRSSRRMMGGGDGRGGMHHDHSDPGYYPGDHNRRHSHHHHGMERHAPRTPEHGHNGVGGRPPNSTGRRQGPPPTSRRNWIQRNEDYSFASSPTVLEPNRRQKAPISNSRHSHSKDRQRQLQRMNEEGQQWFSHDGGDNGPSPRGHHDRMSQSDRDHHHHRGGPPSTRRDRGDRGVDYGHRGHHPMHHHRSSGGNPSGSGRMSSNNSVRSDPHLFMSGSEDDYDSMRGGRPRSPTSQRDLVQIYPGVYVPLRSATETEQAIAGDYYIHSQCIGCNTDIFCIMDAAYVICPLCKFICPLDEMGGPHRHGLGIGFTGKTLCEMKARVRMGGSSVSGSSSHSNLLAHLR